MSSLQIHCNHLWDSHACLNAISRCVADQTPMVAHSLYAVAEHLKLLSLFALNDGWATPEEMRDWMSSLCELHCTGALSHADIVAPVLFPESASHVRMQSVGAMFIPFVRKSARFLTLKVRVEQPIHIDIVRRPYATKDVSANCRISGLRLAHGDDMPRYFSELVVTELRAAR